MEARLGANIMQLLTRFHSRPVKYSNDQASSGNGKPCKQDGRLHSFASKANVEGHARCKDRKQGTSNQSPFSCNERCKDANAKEQRYHRVKAVVALLCCMEDGGSYS